MEVLAIAVFAVLVDFADAETTFQKLLVSGAGESGCAIACVAEDGMDKFDQSSGKCEVSNLASLLVKGEKVDHSEPVGP